MRIIFLLMLMLLQSLNCFADAILPMSCENVMGVTIGQSKKENSSAGVADVVYSYHVVFDITAVAAVKFRRVLSESSQEIYRDGDTEYGHVTLRLLTGDGVVVGDSPLEEGCNDTSVVITMNSKERAFEAARKVCPQIRPKAIFVYDYLEEQRLKKEQAK